jgi:hypothetical protein
MAEATYSLFCSSAWCEMTEAGGAAWRRGAASTQRDLDAWARRSLVLDK